MASTLSRIKSPRLKVMLAPGVWMNVRSPSGWIPTKVNGVASRGHADAGRVYAQLPQFAPDELTVEIIAHFREGTHLEAHPCESRRHIGCAASGHDTNPFCSDLSLHARDRILLDGPAQ